VDTRILISPPYCGLPSESHQFPAVAALVVAGGLVVDVVTGTVVDAVVFTAVVVVDDEAGVVVDVVQDANTRDVTIKQVSAIQIIPLFI
jgi:hypothetical protein